MKEFYNIRSSHLNEGCVNALAIEIGCLSFNLKVQK